MATVVLTAATAAVPVAGATADVVDRSFGTDGVLSLDLPGDDWPPAMVETADGNLALAISSERGLWIAMASADGHLVASFADGGIKNLRLADETYVVGLAPTLDGGMLVAAWLSDESDTPLGDQRFVLAKLRADGRLDTSYGTRGLATTAVGELAPIDLGAHRFAATADGGAVVVGTTGVASYFGAAGVAALLRFTPTGQRDAHFGVDGIAPIASDAAYPAITGLAVAPDGDILVTENNHAAGPFRSESVVRRFTPTGAPDRTFGVAGVAVLPIPGDWKSISDVVVDRTGRIVCLGYTGAGLTGVVTDHVGLPSPVRPDDGFSPLIARLLPNGQPDATYGDDGLAFFNTDAKGTRLSWSGNFAVTATVTYLTAYEERVDQLRPHLLRITDAGTIDPAYGAGHAVPLMMQNSFGIVALPTRVVVAGERSSESGGTIAAGFRR